MSLLKPRCLGCGGIDAGGNWVLGFPAHPSVRCYAIVSGQCWLTIDGVPGVVRVEAGDCFVLPHGNAFRIGSDLSLAPVDFKAIVDAPLQGSVTTFNGGGECFGVGGAFELDPQHADMLVGMLPPIVHIHNESDRIELRWALERMMQELHEPKPGGSLVIQQLASMILVQALRLHVAEGARGSVGWLFALADPEMRAAIELMHGDPSRRWTIQELAERIGMSRSNFALKFKTAVGVSPMDYLTRWRMLLAGDRLTHSGDPIADIAASLGYESESAFSAAFKRLMNCSPRQYSRRAVA